MDKVSTCTCNVFHTVYMNNNLCSTGIDNSMQYFSGTSISILEKSPESIDVYRLLKKKSADWRAFRKELRLDDNYEEKLGRNCSLTDEDRLAKVLAKWIEKQPSPVTWNNILEVLKELELLNIAQKVKNYLQKEDVVKKYRKKNNFFG